MGVRYAMTVRVDAPCLLMLGTRQGTANLSVADPTQKLDRLQITLGGRYAGHGCYYLAQERATAIVVDLPKHEFAGRTVQIALRPE